ncbi:MAG: acetylglutamate kinase [Bacteroidota bacterium]
MKQPLSIIKIGGNLIEDAQQLTKVLHLFSKKEGRKILVHGGGKKATEIGNRLGIEAKMTHGRRITDAASLEVAIMVYGGLVNKSIVAKLQSLGTNALGMSGADGNAIQAHKRPVKEVDFGFVGDVDSVQRENLSRLLDAGFSPVFCALTHDGKGQLFNTNADTIAAELAVGLAERYETNLFYCFEKKGVLEDIANEDSVIEHINTQKYQALLQAGSIADGMLPKMHNCFYALENQVQKVHIGNTSMLNQNPSTHTTLTL